MHLPEVYRGDDSSLTMGASFSHYGGGNRSSNEKKASRPAFEQLPLRSGDPQWSAWGLWGDDDQLGALNHLDAETTRNAAKEIQEGIVVPLK